MGSRLVERDSGRVVWGLRPLKLAGFWTSPRGLAELALTPAELDAVHGGTYVPATARLQPRGLLAFPVQIPGLTGIEPYRHLVGRVRDCVLAPEAVLEFAYDWRLPVTLNARLLADAADAHLRRWRERSPEARLVIVAHSMGGLLARGLSLIPGATDDVRLTVTLGTPFYGSVKAALLLAHGDGVPLPSSRLRDAAATMPGVYDLLPTYRCLRTRDGGHGITRDDGTEDFVRLTVEDVAALGADRDLAEAALRRHDDLEKVPVVAHRPLVGTHQPTLQSLTITDGVATGAAYGPRWEADDLSRDHLGRPVVTDHGGDGTVYRYAAAPQGVKPFEVAQSHGGLAKSRSMLAVVENELTHQPSLGIRLGAGDLGLDVPEHVTAGERGLIAVTGERDPALVECWVDQIGDEDGDVVVGRPRPARRRGTSQALEAEHRFAEPGLYRVNVKTGGSEPVTRLVLCTASADGGPGTA